jgi:hypothetical protein
MRLTHLSIETYILIGVLAIGLIFFAWVAYEAYLIVGNNCPPGQVRGELGAPSGCVPASYYPTFTPAPPTPTTTPHPAYPWGN